MLSFKHGWFLVSCLCPLFVGGCGEGLVENPKYQKLASLAMNAKLHHKQKDSEKVQCSHFHINLTMALDSPN